MTPSKDQFIGCLIGQSLGDALGFPVEGCPSKYCLKYWNDVLTPGKMFSKSLGNNIFFGQYTDDTQLARELLESYLIHGAFLPQDYANRIAAIFKEKRIVGKGQATENAAFNIMKGIPWNESGTPSPAAGNGSAMRAAPIGMLFFHDENILVKEAVNQGIITHKDPRASAGAILIAGATSMALQKEKSSEKICAFLSRLTKRWDPILSEFLENKFLKIILLEPLDAVNEIKRVGMSSDYKEYWPGISPFVTPSVLWSLYSFLKNKNDYWETIRTSIIVGGDVDTTAAMAGAISGAYIGVKGIPENYAKIITDRGTWNYENLVNLATKIHDLVVCRKKRMYS